MMLASRGAARKITHTLRSSVDPNVANPLAPRSLAPAPPLLSLPSVSTAAAAFSQPIQPPDVVPADLEGLVAAVTRWDEATRQGWIHYESRSTYRRALHLGMAVADAIRLQRAIRTRRIDQWLASAPAAHRAAFEEWRAAFFNRCDAIAAVATEGLIATDLVMPEEGIAAMAVRNPAQIGRMLSGHSSLAATVSVYAASAVLVAREWEFFGPFVGRQLRRGGLRLGLRGALRRVARLNAQAGRTLVTRRHVEPFVAVYHALGDRGIRGPAADTLVLRALEDADQTSGKPWKGLTRLYELVVYSGALPGHPDWEAAYSAAMRGAVEYTHVPGREWIVRDYTVGRHLMQLDGRVAPGDRWAGLQQGRSSLATGYLRGGQDRTAFGRRYSKPLAAFLDSMVVAEGTDHQRQRKAFLPFFSQAAVLVHAPFVERTVHELLDRADAVARQNGGRFDFRSDFAYHFPIRIICHVLDLPPEDVGRVQHWAEAAVRAMDTEAGVSFATAAAGQHASAEFRAYLAGKLAEARAGTFAGHVIATVAHDATLTEDERIANLGVIIFAGFETTTGLLSKGMDALLRNPEQRRWLLERLIDDRPVQAGDGVLPDHEWRWLSWAEAQPERSVDRERRDRLRRTRDASPDAAARFAAVRRQEEMLDRVIEELLRWTAPGTVVPLTASRTIAVPLEAPHVIRGCPHAAGASLEIQRGETIAVAVDELNRRCPVAGGEFRGPRPEEFDVTRPENTKHLSFGLRHSCIGAFLAKENAKRALEQVLRRFPDLEPAGDPIPQEMELFSGLASLPVAVPRYRDRGMPALRTLVMVSALAALAVPATGAQARPCDLTPGAHGPSRDLYCMELVPAPGLGALTGRVELAHIPGPFTVAVTPAGHHRYQPIFHLGELPQPASLGPYGVFIAWAMTPGMERTVRLGPVAAGRTSLQPIGLEKFLIVVTAERDTAGTGPQGRIVLRAQSPSTRLQPPDFLQFAIGSMVDRNPVAVPPVAEDSVGHHAHHRAAVPPGDTAVRWPHHPMHPRVQMLPAEMALTPRVAPYLPSPVDSARVRLVKPRQVVDLGHGDTLRLEAQLVRRMWKGKPFLMYGFNGQQAGPLLRVQQGAEVVVEFTNGLDQPTTVHWHGIRLDNRFDGVPDLTQDPVPPGGRFTYHLRFPDAGVYWYHPHVREDLQQDLGLYGNLMVRSPRADYYGPAHREEILLLDDLLVGDAGLIPWGAEATTHALMGRFGNVFLVNGEPGWTTVARRGEVVRFFLTNVSNTRTLNLSFGAGTRMKVVAGDVGNFQREAWVESVVIAPAERYVVHVRFDEPGVHALVNRVRGLDHVFGRFFQEEDTLGVVRVDGDAMRPDLEAAFGRLRTDTAATGEIARFRRWFDRPVDRTLVFALRTRDLPFVTRTLMEVDSAYFAPVEWSGTMPHMNWASTGRQVTWTVRDPATGKENMQIDDWRFRVGDVVKLRFSNARESFHAMQHPIHLHGQRFLVLTVNGVAQENLAWKDTVLVPTGSTIELLVEMSNPGRWMLHCHIAEHLSADMMMEFQVSP